MGSKFLSIAAIQFAVISYTARAMTVLYKDEVITLLNDLSMFTNGVITLFWILASSKSSRVDCFVQDPYICLLDTHNGIPEGAYLEAVLLRKVISNKSYI